MMVILQNQS